MSNIKKGFITPIILRTGGIGDLIALSSISYYIPMLLDIKHDILKFVSQEKYKAVFPWFKERVQFISYFSPINKVKYNSIVDLNRIKKTTRPVYFEGIIESSKENWFNIQYENVGVSDFKEEYGRPILKTERIYNDPSNIDISKKSILVNPRSTAIIRSMRFEDIYMAIINIIGNDDVNIYVHDRNIRQIDEEFINGINDSRIKIISAKSLKQFFLDAYDATLTVSVDTALLHFREGVAKCGIGIYGPFPYECRSKYYKHTLSFNIKSDCPNMPCFVHVKKPDAICDYQQLLHDNGKYDKNWYDVAPCCCNIYNSTVVEQLIDNMKDYLIKTLKGE